jgi:hypothetical protein
LVFTDLVGSTEQRARLGDAAGDEFRRAHDQIVARAAAASDGVVVKGTGDGALLAFSSAAGAIDAAVAIQQRIERRNRDVDEPLALRTGISLGEVTYEAGDLHGLAVNEAARVCALAQPGEVLVTDVVRLIGGTRVGARLAAHGIHELKGLPEPVTVWSVAWEPTGEVARPPLPSLLEPSGFTAFAGRASELAAGAATWAETLGGTRRMLLVSGEPGIGKTRLAAELARRAHDDGALVLYGRCDDELGVPFQPFVEIVDWYVDHADDVVLGRFPGDLGRLSPRVALRTGALPPALQADPETGQYRLFDAVTSWLRSLAAETPLVVVLDDLHWATKATLLMLRHVLRNLDDAPALVVSTYRDTDLDRAHPLGAMLADFRRLDGVDRLALTGLDRAEILEFLERVGEQAADAQTEALATALCDETAGNPFFVGEVLRHLVETERIVRRDGRWTSDLDIGELGIPEGIKDVLGQRLGTLGDAATPVLQAAAVVGRDFSLGDVVAASGLGEDDVLASIEMALPARLVEETGPDRYRFGHALVRTALMEEVSTSRRLRLHRRTAEHLERTRGEPGAVAHHWLEAASSGDPERAVDAVHAGAQHAIERGAYDDAVALLTRGVGFAEELELEGALRRELALQLGEAQKLAGDSRARDTLVAVYAAAEVAGDTDRLVRATLATSRGFAGNIETVDVAHLARHHAALDALGGAPTRERAALLTSLAAELAFHFDDRRLTYIHEARDIARELGDAALLATVLVTRSFVVFPFPAEQDLWVGEIASIFDDLDPVTRLRARGLLHQLATHRGRIDDARAELDRMREGLVATPTAISRWTLLNYDAKMASAGGRLADAERLNNEQLASGLELGFADARIFWLAQDINLARDLGRARERIALYQSQFERTSAGTETAVEPTLRAVYAVFSVDAEDVVAAEEYLIDELEAGLPVSRERFLNCLDYAYHLAETAAALWHVDAASILYELLRGFEGRTAGAQISCDGFVDRPLGRLATVLGRYEDAAAHLEAAACLHERAGFPLYLARTWADQATLELRQGGDDGVARALVERAVQTARRHGASGVEQYAVRVLDTRPA